MRLTSGMKAKNIKLPSIDGSIFDTESIQGKPFMVSFLLFFLLMMISCIKVDSPETIELSESWRFSPDKQNIGMSEKWYALNFDDSHWDKLDAGIRWEDQGYPNLDSLAWYRKVVQIPSDWEGEYVWLIIGGVNDTYTLFINGERINSFGDRINVTVAEKTTVAEVSGNLKYGEPNLITIQVYDWGNSGGLWHLPVKITTDKNEMENVALLDCFVIYEKNELWVNTNLSPLGNEQQGESLNIKIRKDQNDPPVAKQKLKLTRDKTTVLAKMRMPQVQEKTIYTVTEEIINHQGKIILSLSKKVEWNPPHSQPDKNGIKQLNNFVDELLNEKIPGQDKTSFKFLNLRDGWIFFSVKTLTKNRHRPVAHLDQNSNSLVFRINPETGANEAMQFLAKGEHTLDLKHASDSQVIVRSIPEIIYSDHPSSPHITPYGPYDWSYLTKYVLSNVNTIVTSASSLSETELEQWVKEGRNWIVHAGLPGLGKTLPPTVEEVYESWAKSPGTIDPRFNGIIVDEFNQGTPDHYLAWTRALSSLYKNPDFSDKVFYAYCTAIFYAPTAPAIPFGKRLLEYGGRFALERYLPEQPTEEQAYSLLFEKLSHTYKIIQKNLDKGEQHLIIVLGYLTDLTETLSIYPSVDYRVFMDMQFHLLATDPTFRDLYGIQEYLSSYADEELLRWAHRLFRHYCIEGKRTRFTDDPYILPHLQNPDFAEGLQEWTIEPAEEGSIQPKSMPGYSWLQGRYPNTSFGDQFIRFKRSAKQPNIIRQKVKKLDPTRLYSLKLIAADLQDLHKKQELALSIKLDQVEIIKDYTFQFVYPSNYGHELGPYTRNHPAWFNFHRIVFRPKGKTAELTISDWSNSTHSNGPVGQEVICNFIEIHPFYEK